MRDPRNWVRPAVAIVAGTAAGGALVLLRARRRAPGRPAGGRRALRGARPLRPAGACATSRARRAGCSATAERSPRRRRARRVGSLPRMATCYRHPSRETAVSCSTCGRPICPDCMTPTPVGMRCPECSRQRTKVMRMRDMAKRPARHLRADRDQRDRVPHRAGAVHALRHEHPRHGDRRRRPVPRGDRRTSSTGGWCTSAFLHENLLHIGFNMYLLYLLGHDARAGDRLAALRGRSTSPRCSTGSFGVVLATRRRASAPRAPSSG